jgi:putative hydrolase of the HAD superfamily
MLKIIAFDADDTLWHTEFLYARVQKRVREILQPYYPYEDMGEHLHRIEVNNLNYYGYGIKGFILSLIESSISLSGGKISGAELQEIITLAKDMLQAEIRFMVGAVETVRGLMEQYPLMLITKGDLFEQDAKIVRSGIKDLFRYVEIVSDKNREGYSDVLRKVGVKPDEFLMVGNSMRSDILPVIEIGGYAVFVPHAESWVHEHAEPPQDADGRFFEIERLPDLPMIISSIEKNIIKQETGKTGN